MLLPLLFLIALTRIDGSSLPHIAAPQDQSTQAEVARWTAQLKSGDQEQRRDAVMVLSRIDDDNAVSALISAVTDSSPSVRAHVLSALGERSETKVLPYIVARLTSDKDPYVRKAGAYALAKFSSPERTAGLIAGLKDKDQEVRGAAAVSLGDHPDPSAIAPLAAALSDKNEFVRAHAARALGVNGSSATPVVPALIRLLDSDRDGEVKRRAAAALGLIGDRSALPALERASGDSDSYLAEAARDAIRMIEGK